MLGLGTSLSAAGAVSEVLPSDISGLALWYQNNVGVAVGQWDDSSGNSRHAVQGTASEQAAVSGGGLDFDGADPEDHYDIAESTGYINPGGTNAFTIAFVAKRDDNDDDHAIVGSNTGYLAFLNETNITYRSNAITQFTFAADTWAQDAQFLCTITKDTSGNFLFWKNGVSISPTASSNAPNTDATWSTIKLFGAKHSGESTGSFTWDGIIYEVVMYDTQLTGSNLADLNSYLTSKFGL